MMPTGSEPGDGAPLRRYALASQDGAAYNVSACGIGEVVSQQLPKLLSRVRIPYAAPLSLFASPRQFQLQSHAANRQYVSGRDNRRID